MMMTATLDTDKAWRAVLTRDRRADGTFVYAVRSTGIYCRPSCPSRRPARRNVRFYRDPAGAELEGFRPCRRCGETLRVAMVGEAPRERTMFYCPRCQGGLAPTDDGRPQRPLGTDKRTGPALGDRARRR